MQIETLRLKSQAYKYTHLLLQLFLCYIYINYKKENLHLGSLANISYLHFYCTLYFLRFNNVVMFP
jgi:hypothetical protein